MSDFEKTFGNGRALTCDLEDYWHALSGEGELGGQWEDKPHRLVFDLIAACLSNDAENARLREALASIAEVDSLSDMYCMADIARAALLRAGKGEEGTPSTNRVLSEKEREYVSHLTPAPVPSCETCVNRNRDNAAFCKGCKSNHLAAWWNGEDK